LLVEDVEIDVETRQRVLVMLRTIDTADYYQLLGVEKSADRKALRRAYFDLAAKMHPDRYFRKKLGSFKVRLETIFSRLSQAHDTLRDEAKRAEYDTYLAEQRRSRGIEELLADALAEVKRAQETVEAEAREASVEPAAEAPPSPAPARPSVPPTSTVEISMAARREALAKRLLGGRRSSASIPPVRVSSRPAPPVPSAGDAMASLRRRYEDRKAQARAAQTQKYVAMGDGAKTKGDAVAAANAYRVAATLSPDDEAVQKVAREAQTKADEVLADTYMKQASYEEKNGQWIEAARSWVRVCRVRPDAAQAHERAANAFVKAGADDLHEAARLAQRACTLEPTNTPYRVTLAGVYLAAGLALNARRELETAAQHAPHDGTIQAMLKRASKPA
jgi:curved DNA-binding protein CbpA